MSTAAKHRISADIGGTFTDIAFLTPEGVLATRKLLSTPANYADAVIAGITELMTELDLPLADIDEVIHGCTVAANAILEHKGAKITLVGDPDQCIFEFSMADATSLPNLKEKWDIPELSLSQSFRCNNQIAAAVRNVGGTAGRCVWPGVAQR